jgi:serine/threonine-protein kinase
MEAATQQSRAQYLRFGNYGLGLWLLTAPVVALLGVRAWLPLILTSALCLTALLYGAWLRRSGDLSEARVHGLSALTLLTLASVSSFMGPFVLVPQAIAVTTLYIALQCRTARERRVVIAMGAAAAALPFALELLGVLPPAYTFADGNVTLLGRLLPLTPRTTQPLLVYASVTFVALPAVLLGGVRDALSSAERRLFLQAWHLRQLVPERTDGAV